MHNCFQVGSSSGPRPTTSSPLPESMAAINISQSNAHATETRDGQCSSGRTSDSSGSLVMMGQKEASGLKSSALSDKKPQVSEIKPETLPPANLPTPPHCSATSLLQKEPDETEMASSIPDKGMGSSVVTAFKSYLSAPSGTTASSESPAPRHTSHPVSSVSDNTVLASHFSNPCLPALNSPVPSPPDHDHENPPCVSMPSENIEKLTLAADASHLKNTPPLTPRAMSNEGTHPESKKQVTSYPQSSDQSRPQQTDDVTNGTEDISGKVNEAFPSEKSRSASPQTGGGSVGSIKGKLRVTICEARGLRPGFDPYVVCVFESNEVISKSAHDEEEASIERQQKEQEKSDIEAGRPIAIPLKSRQSSSNSLPSLLEGQDPKGKVMTDPHWNHEALLCVFLFDIFLSSFCC